MNRVKKQTRQILVEGCSREREQQMQTSRRRLGWTFLRARDGSGVHKGKPSGRCVCPHVRDGGGRKALRADRSKLDSERDV